jgi:hypothetical protein
MIDVYLVFLVFFFEREGIFMKIKGFRENFMNKVMILVLAIGLIFGFEAKCGLVSSSARAISSSAGASPSVSSSTSTSTSTSTAAAAAAAAEAQRIADAAAARRAIDAAAVAAAPVATGLCTTASYNAAVAAGSPVVNIEFIPSGLVGGMLYVLSSSQETAWMTALPAINYQSVSAWRAATASLPSSGSVGLYDSTYSAANSIKVNFAMPTGQSTCKVVIFSPGYQPQLVSLVPVSTSNLSSGNYFLEFASPVVQDSTTGVQAILKLQAYNATTKTYVPYGAVWNEYKTPLSDTSPKSIVYNLLSYSVEITQQGTATARNIVVCNLQPGKSVTLASSAGNAQVRGSNVLLRFGTFLVSNTVSLIIPTSALNGQDLHLEAAEYDYPVCKTGATVGGTQIATSAPPPPGAVILVNNLARAVSVSQVFPTIAGALVNNVGVPANTSVVPNGSVSLASAPINNTTTGIGGLDVTITVPGWTVMTIPAAIFSSGKNNGKRLYIKNTQGMDFGCFDENGTLLASSSQIPVQPMFNDVPNFDC